MNYMNLKDRVKALNVLKKSMKCLFKKMEKNPEFAKAFVDFLEKWGCLKYV